jgi:hypothetical protein
VIEGEPAQAMLPEDPTHHPLGFGTRATERVVERHPQAGPSARPLRARAHGWQSIRALAGRRTPVRGNGTTEIIDCKDPLEPSPVDPVSRKVRINERQDVEHRLSWTMDQQPTKPARFHARNVVRLDDGNAWKSVACRPCWSHREHGGHAARQLMPAQVQGHAAGDGDGNGSHAQGDRPGIAKLLIDALGRIEHDAPAVTLRPAGIDAPQQRLGCHAETASLPNRDAPTLPERQVAQAVRDLPR